jgi:hypothetical protein
MAAYRLDIIQKGRDEPLASVKFQTDDIAGFVRALNLSVWPKELAANVLDEEVTHAGAE